ncbi:MAG: UbiX family flavin prenyltransferase [Rikenellaceae bacterium]|jgi:4-hydroxy-3-polyprenylbenzoate decarboxylase|nr:UbiX family flavin prenyltransferase [Rikenellaceae bacterium]
MEAPKQIKRIIVAVTGASGSLYARLLVEQLVAFAEVELSVIVTDTGLSVMRYEDNADWLEDSRLTRYDNHDLFAAPASGSARFDALVVIPCSMGTIGRMAAGLSSDLLTRAADVMLKERRRLIVVPRELPLNTIHLRNLATLSECGAIVCPASPSFYNHPQTIEALCQTVTHRVIALLGLDSPSPEWGK